MQAAVRPMLFDRLVDLRRDQHAAHDDLAMLLRDEVLLRAFARCFECDVEMTDELVAIHHVVMDMGRQCGCSCCTEPAERQAGAHRLDQNSGHALPYADTACCSTAVAGTSNNWKHSSTAPQRGDRKSTRLNSRH